MKDISALLVSTLALSFAVSAIAEPVRIAVKPGESLAAARDAVRALPREIGLGVTMWFIMVYNMVVFLSKEKQS